MSYIILEKNPFIAFFHSPPKSWYTIFKFPQILQDPFWQQVTRTADSISGK